MAVGRVELQLWRDSTMAGGGGNGQCALTKTQSVQPRGGGGRGEHGGAADRLAVAFLWRRVSQAMAERFGTAAAAAVTKEGDKGNEK